MRRALLRTSIPAPCSRCEGVCTATYGRDGKTWGFRLQRPRALRAHSDWEFLPVAEDIAVFLTRD